MDNGFLSKLEKNLLWFFDLGRVVIFIAVVAVVFYYTLGQIFLVSGVSMNPNFEDGQWLTISKINHYVREPTRGEVIVFYFPGTKQDKYIKRIIGLPGDKIEVKKGQVYVNDNKLYEGYLEEGKTTEGQVSVKLEKGEYFVMGDNRDQSNDSRAWGPLPREKIIGQAVFSLFPGSSRGVIPVPGYHLASKKRSVTRGVDNF